MRSTTLRKHAFPAGSSSETEKDPAEKGIPMDRAENAKNYPHRIMKFCPRCGSSGFRPREDEEAVDEFIPSKSLVCPSCGFQFFINQGASTAAVIVNDHNEMLLIRRNRNPHKGMLDLPGGFVDPGETAEDAVRREIYEECNLQVSQIRPYKKTYCNEYFYGGIIYFTLDILYLCEAVGWVKLKANDWEEGEPLCIPLEEIRIEDIGLASIKRMVQDVLADMGIRQGEK